MKYILIILSIIFMLLLLFLYSALKMSSMCYDEEELIEIDEQFDEDLYE